jgi:hypothetical protein
MFKWWNDRKAAKKREALRAGDRKTSSGYGDDADRRKLLRENRK